MLDPRLQLVESMQRHHPGWRHPASTPAVLAHVAAMREALLYGCHIIFGDDPGMERVCCHWPPAILIQMSLLYLTPAAFKVSPLWTAPTVSHNAIYYVLANKSFCRENIVTTTLLSYPVLLQLLSVVTPCLEHITPIFIFGSNIPLLRVIGIVILLSFHLGLHVTMTLGLFPWICMAGWVLLIPPECWGNWGHGPVLTTNTTNIDNNISPTVAILAIVYHSLHPCVCGAALLCSVHSCIDCLPGPHQGRLI